MSRDRMGMGLSLLAIGLVFAWVVWRFSLVLAGLGILTALFGLVITLVDMKEE